jgi:hypothetical protein
MSKFTLSSGKVVRMAPSRAEQDELHRAIVGRTDPTATARAFELLLEPLTVRLRFRWPNMSQDEFESWAIDALITYLENPARYDPKQSALLTYLVMDADGDIKNAYSSARATRERFLEASKTQRLVGMRRRMTKSSTWTTALSTRGFGTPSQTRATAGTVTDHGTTKPRRRPPQSSRRSRA